MKITISSFLLDSVLLFLGKQWLVQMCVKGPLRYRNQVTSARISRNKTEIKQRLGKKSQSREPNVVGYWSDL